MTDTTVAALTAMRDRHVPFEGSGYCECGHPIPCDTVDALDALDAARRRVGEHERTLWDVANACELAAQWRNEDHEQHVENLRLHLHETASALRAALAAPHDAEGDKP